MHNGIIAPEIKEYIEKHIIPLYIGFDKAHDINHVEKVISNSMSICSEYDVNRDMVYVIAAYHDSGLMYGRENHEKTSAEYLLNDSKLKTWFSDEEIQLMSQAVQDHRASNDSEPRSIYGKIVADADRDIDYCTILTRTIQYGLEHYSNYSYEQHFERTYGHLQSKYSEKGYLKLWLNSNNNYQRLSELRRAIRSESNVRSDFEKIFLILQPLKNE